MTIADQEGRLQALLQPPTASRFSSTSRYSGIGTAVLDPDGDHPVVYLRRRFVPRAETLTEIGAHVVVAGERTDQVAAAELGDPELYWRLCDGNRGTFAEDLVREPGRRLRLTLPEGGSAP